MGLLPDLRHFCRSLLFDINTVSFSRMYGVTVASPERKNLQDVFNNTMFVKFHQNNKTLVANWYICSS